MSWVQSDGAKDAASARTDLRKQQVNAVALEFLQSIELSHAEAGGSPAPNHGSPTKKSSASPSGVRTSSIEQPESHFEPTTAATSSDENSDVCFLQSSSKTLSAYAFLTSISLTREDPAPSGKDDPASSTGETIENLARIADKGSSAQSSPGSSSQGSSSGLHHSLSYTQSHSASTIASAPGAAGFRPLVPAPSALYRRRQPAFKIMPLTPSQHRRLVSLRERRRHGLNSRTSSRHFPSADKDDGHDVADDRRAETEDSEADSVVLERVPVQLSSRDMVYAPCTRQAVHGRVWLACRCVDASSDCSISACRCRAG